MSDEIDQISTPPPSASPVAPGTMDRNGVAFDPARHIAKKHPTTGRWMPKGGRKRTPPAPSAESTQAQQTPTKSENTEHAAPAPCASDPLPDFSAIDKAAAQAAIPSAELPAGEKSAAAAVNLEIVEASDDIAEIISNGFYNLAGFIFDAPEEWGLTGAEHSRTRKAIAAYVRTRNGTITPGKALLILGVAYLLRGLAKPKSKAKAKEWTAAIRAKLFPSKNTQPAAPAAAATAPLVVTRPPERDPFKV